MKKIIIAAIIVIAITGVGLVFYFVSQSGNEVAKNSNSDTPSLPVNQPKANEKPDLSKESSPYVGDDFTIIAPPGWIQTHMPTTLVSFQNNQEKHPNGSAAAKINFKSYMAVSFDNTQGKTLDDIVKLVKQQTQNVAPLISFVSETDGTIDGQPAKFLEAGLNQQNVDFKVLMAIVLKENKYFTISANTTAEKWTNYRDAFYNTANSFKFKK